MKKSGLYSFYIIVAGVLWGCTGMLVRQINAAGFSSMEVALWRILTSAIIVAVVIFVKDKSLFKFKLKDIWVFLGSGIVSLAFFSICYFQNIITTSMAIACTMLYTSPVFVVLFSAVLFKEKITVRKVVAIVLTLVGCLFVTGAISGSLVLPAKGIVLGICSGLGYALYSIFGRYGLEKGYDSFTITFYTFVFAALAMMVPANIGGMFVKLSRLDNVVSMILIILVTAVISAVLPYMFYTLGLRGVENGKASILVAVEPVVASIVGVVVFKDEVSVVSLVGIVLVLASIVLLSLKNKSE